MLWCFVQELNKAPRMPQLWDDKEEGGGAQAAQK